MIVWISTISWMSTSAAIVDVVRALRDLEHREGEHREPGPDDVDVRSVAGDDAFALEPVDARVHGAAGDADLVPPTPRPTACGVRRSGVEQSQIGGIERPGHGVQRGPPDRAEIKDILSKLMVANIGNLSSDVAPRSTDR